MSNNPRKALIIVNPVSGGIDKTAIIEQIKRELSPEIQQDFLYWTSPRDKDEFIRRIKEDTTINIVIAIGGDGTINQVAGAMAGSDKIMGIIPVGSGNGLARHLKIPLNVTDAIKVINKGSVIKIDACTVNGNFFLCTSGIGFDAHIGALFAQSKTRGFYTYLKLTLKEFRSYGPQEYIIYCDDKQINTNAFLVTFANASQYGNNAYIAPQADISDGLIDICILKPFRAWHFPGLARRMFNKTIPRSRFIETHRGKKIKVLRNFSAPVHFDGEPVELGKELTYEIMPSAVNVLV